MKKWDGVGEVVVRQVRGREEGNSKEVKMKMWQGRGRRYRRWWGYPQYPYAYPPQYPYPPQAYPPPMYQPMPPQSLEEELSALEDYKRGLEEEKTSIDQEISDVEARIKEIKTMLEQGRRQPPRPPSRP